MQTFLPYPDFAKSAQCLDMRRLGKQRVEAKQIYLALTQPGYGWQNHPAVKMWKGYENSLAHYGMAVIKEWMERGYSDSLYPFFANVLITTGPEVKPSWLGNPDFHRSHQSNLLRKDFSHYHQFFPDVPINLPYIWPSETNLMAVMK